ncbi:response regulator, partial [candidate division KSB1 bacterium]|nr:response regulator [candidate division KSB1 bacterium]
MVVLIVVLTVVVFIIVDAVLRIVMRKMQESKTAKERKEALDIGLRLDFADEAKSLKRVEVENPKAKILAVDDEEIILDSFRKILVFAGYSVDTVEKGPEALSLVKKNDYDFVFTDLKMPEMDGIEVTKAVKHLRPDIDVIVITGYASIESAVATMKYGAMDYVQKPFTEDELVDFVNKFLIRRQDRIDRTIKSKVHLITPSHGESKSKHEFNVPAGVFISPAHNWVKLELNGLVRIGIDDFTQKTLGKIDDLELPKAGLNIKKGEPLFTIKQGSYSMKIPSPVSGKVATVNTNLNEHIEYVNMKTYELGWICNIEPANLTDELKTLKIGADTVSWYQKEIDKFSKMVTKINSEEKEAEMKAEQLNEKVWEAFPDSFLQATFK